MTALFRFLQLVLRLTPPLLWWALGGLVFALLNSGFHDEVWPNTPLARPFFLSLLFSCLMTLPWIAARIAWHLADVVDSFFWKAIWRLAGFAGYGGASLGVVGGTVALSLMWSEWLSTH